ncbi:hypothetical protein ACTJIL_02600 [Luteimonas sp. 22616]|uniref:hypothetical protein n=1 Tax=Luteimonas sp. 22616 TaxID=3453951 RepID=UPI003F8459BE
MGQDTSDYDGHFVNYAEYSKTLRSWLVAYGIGAPVLFLLSKDAPETISRSPHLKTIVTLFVVGVALQIFLSFLNKWAAWNMYRGAYAKQLESRGDSECDNHHKSKTYRIWCFINKQSWIDMAVDVGALGCFSVATWIVLEALLSASSAT